MHKKGILFFCLLAAGTSIFAGDFITDFQAAQKLYDSDKYAEAEKAFIELSVQGDKKSSDNCLKYAAYSASRQKKDAEAAELIEKIQDKKIALLVQMTILLEKRKADEVIALCQDEDFEKWPDAIIYDAFLTRGKAYLAKKDELAEKDLLNSLKYTISTEKKVNAYLSLVNFYKDMKKDNQKVIDAYGEILKLKDVRFSTACTVLVMRANMLAAEGKKDTAVSELEKFDAPEKKTQGNFYARVLLCAGEIYQDMGKKDEALAKYKEIIAIPKIPQDMADSAKKKIELLESKK